MIREGILQELQNQKKSIRSLSRDTGINVSNISRILHGEISPNLDTIERIADALNMEIKLEKRIEM